MLALEIVAGRAALAGQAGAPDADEFIRNLIALGMVGEQAVGLQFALVAAGDDIDQQAPVRQAVEGGAMRTARPGVDRPGRIATRNFSFAWR
jgi:hypothetical protein